MTFYLFWCRLNQAFWQLTCLALNLEPSLPLHAHDIYKLLFMSAGCLQTATETVSLRSKTATIVVRCSNLPKSVFYYIPWEACELHGSGWTYFKVRFLFHRLISFKPSMIGNDVLNMLLLHLTGLSWWHTSTRLMLLILRERLYLTLMWISTSMRYVFLHVTMLLIFF